jgi:hypothetical protein
LLGLVGLLAATVIAAALGFEPWLRARIEAQALRHGAKLTFESYSLRFGELALQRVSFVSEGPVRLQGQAELVKVQLSWLSPRALHADAVRVNVTGSPREALGHGPNREALPALRVTRLTLEWRERPEAGVALALRSASLASTTQGTDVAGHVTLFGKALGHTTFNWNRAEQKASASVWLEGLPPSSERFPAPTFTVDITSMRGAIALNARLHDAPLEPLLRRLDPLATPQAAVASATLELHSPKQGEGHGKLALRLERFVAPYPPALAGLAMGTLTEVDSKLVLAGDFRRIRLEQLELRAGALQLRGAGVLSALGAKLQADLELRGGLACAAVAAAAAAPESPLAGRALDSGQPLPVTLVVHLDSSDVNGTRVFAEHGSGCGLNVPP